MKIRTLILPAAALLCLIYAAVSIANTTPQRILTDPPQSPPRSSFQHTVAAPGIIEPSSENIAIGSPLPGLVMKVHVAAGDSVKKGDPLFEIDQRQLLSQKQVATAKISQSIAAKAATSAQLDQATRRLAAAQALTADRAIAAEETADRASEVARLEAELLASAATIQLAEAELASIETELARSIVRAPISASVLQVRVREGEFIDGSTTAAPRLIIGITDPLHIRVDIDEFEIPRLIENAPAKASPRGSAEKSYELEFICHEPFVIPKRSLTGDSTERVDTRVLQSIYKIKSPDASIFTGQQVDVFIEAKPHSSSK